MTRLNTGGRIGVALAFVALSALPFSGARSSAQESDADLIDLSGTGGGEINALMTEWSRPMYDSAAPVGLGYVVKGDKDGRGAFSRGENDFVVSGRPFTETENATLSGRGVGVIEAPIAVSAMALLVSAPRPLGLETLKVEGDDPDDPDAIITKTQFPGPVLLQNDIVARTMLDVQVNNWNQPAFAETIAPLVPVQQQAGLEPLVRSDPGAMNFYLEQFVHAFAKDQYNAKLSTEVHKDPDLISENWPFLSTPSRAHDDPVAGLIGAWDSPRGVQPAGGVIGPVSPSQATHQMELQDAKRRANKPATPLYVAQIQNAAAEWVGPNPDSISKAAEAGGATPLFAMTNPVAGAYPLTWISTIAMPSTGLSPQKATALATVVRYAVTVGQAATVALGEGHLPASLVAQALDAADKVIAGNCTGADRRIDTVGDGGPSWPKGVPAPTSATVCIALATDAPTTTQFIGPGNSQQDLVTPPPTTVAFPSTPLSLPPSSGLGNSSGSGSSGLLPGSDFDASGLPDAAVESASESAAGDGGESTTTEPDIAASTVASVLPMPLPGDGRFGLDRLVTAILGGLAFLLVRGSLRKRGGTATA